MYVTLTGTDYYMGTDALSINQILTLKKDYENRYDDEAIAVLNNSGVKMGYVANSVNTVSRGTHSAGYIYNTFKDEAECRVLFIAGNAVIAEIENKEHKQ